MLIAMMSSQDANDAMEQEVYDRGEALLWRLITRGRYPNLECCFHVRSQFHMLSLTYLSSTMPRKQVYGKRSFPNCFGSANSLLWDCDNSISTTEPACKQRTQTEPALCRRPFEPLHLNIKPVKRQGGDEPCVDSKGLLQETFQSLSLGQASNKLTSQPSRVKPDSSNGASQYVEKSDRAPPP